MRKTEVSVSRGFTTLICVVLQPLHRLSDISDRLMVERHKTGTVSQDVHRHIKASLDEKMSKQANTQLQKLKKTLLFGLWKTNKQPPPPHINNNTNSSSILL